MATPEPRYSRAEFARRGQEIYERDILPVLKPEDDYKFVAIDIETGDWEMDARDIVAGQRLRSRHPDAQTWLMRVGEKAACRIRTPFRVSRRGGTG